MARCALELGALEVAFFFELDDALANAILELALPCPLERRLRAAQIARTHEREAEVALRALIARLLLDDALQAVARRCVVAELQLGEAEVEAQRRVVRADLHELLIDLARLGEPLHAEQIEPAQVLHAQIIWCGREQTVERRAHRV